MKKTITPSRTQKNETQRMKLFPHYLEFYLKESCGSSGLCLHKILVLCTGKKVLYFLGLYVEEIGLIKKLCCRKATDIFFALQMEAQEFRNEVLCDLLLSQCCGDICQRFIQLMTVKCPRGDAIVADVRTFKNIRICDWKKH